MVSIGCSKPEHWRCFWRLAKPLQKREVVVGGGPGRDSFEVSPTASMPKEVLGRTLRLSQGGRGQWPV